MRSWTSSPRRYRKPCAHLARSSTRPVSRATASAAERDRSPRRRGRRPRPARADATSATAISAWSSPTVGQLQQAAGWRATAGGASPPTTPATSPQIVSGAASGTATRLAGSATSGIEPNTGMSTGATPICAAAVTPSTSRIHAGPAEPGARSGGPAPRCRGSPRTTAGSRPSAAGTGRRASSTVAASTSTRSPTVGRPRKPATSAIDRHRDGPQHRRLPPRHRAEAARAPRAPATSRPAQRRAAGAAARTTPARTRRSRRRPR